MSTTRPYTVWEAPLILLAHRHRIVRRQTQTAAIPLILILVVLKLGNMKTHALALRIHLTQIITQQKMKIVLRACVTILLTLGLGTGTTNQTIGSYISIERQQGIESSKKFSLKL